MAMKSCFLFVFMILTFGSNGFGFTVITKDGQRVEGVWLSEDNSTIRMKDTNGTVRIFRKDNLDLRLMANAKRSDEEPGSGIPSITNNPVDPSTPKALQPKPVSGRLWAIEAILTNAYDSNINHNSDDIDSVGLVYGAGFRWRSNVTDPAFKIEYEAAKHSYSNTDQWDRISQNLNTSYELFFSKRISLDVDGEASFKGSSEDREIGNQYTVEPQLKFRLNKSNKLEFYGAYRLKRYEEDPTRDATNRYLGLVYELRLIKKSEIALEYRYEENDALSAKHDYYRRRYGISYTIPFKRHNWVNVGFKYRQQNYDSRTVDINVDHGPDLVFLRRDRRYNFNIDFAIRLTENMQIFPGYQYESRNSNDVTKEFTSHFPSLTLLYRWK